MTDGRVQIVTGAPGAGKSTVVEAVTARLADFVVLDMDLLLEPASRLARVDLQQPTGAPWWPAYNDIWMALAQAIAPAHPVLLFAPITPRDLPDLRARWLLLDCADETRRRRLAARGWGPDDIDAAVADARASRALGLDGATTDEQTPDEVAATVAAWASIGR